MNGDAACGMAIWQLCTWGTARVYWLHAHRWSVLSCTPLLVEQMSSASVSCSALLLAAVPRAACSAASSLTLGYNAFSCSPLLMVTPAHGLEVSETLSLKPTASRCPSKMQHNICSVLLLAHMAREQSHSPLFAVVRMSICCTPCTPDPTPLLDPHFATAHLTTHLFTADLMGPRYSVKGPVQQDHFAASTTKFLLSLATQSSLTSSPV